MKHRLTGRPHLESLEGRWCPALSVLFDGSNLTIGDGALMGAPTGGTLTITQGPADVTVADASSLGTYAVTGRISVRLNNVPAVVNFNLGANATAGDVSLTLGNSNDTVSVTGTAGLIGGSLTVNGSNGNDSVTATGVTVGGTLNANLSNGLDTLTVATGSNVGGNLLATGANSFTLADAVTVGGSVSLNSSFESQANMYFFDGTALTPSVVNGNVVISTGAGFSDLVQLQGTVVGNVSANLGNGTNNTFTLDSTGIVAGSLFVVGGTGTDNITLAAGSFVLGNASVSLGDGTNALSIQNTITGSSISYIGGNGQDVLTYGSTAVAAGARLTAYLGNGVDTFNLDASTLASAYVDFGFGADLFVPTVPIGFPLTLRNL